MENKAIREIVTIALGEDVGRGDITATLIPKKTLATAKIISQQSAIICGTKFVDLTFKKIDARCKIKWNVADGDLVKNRQVLCAINGPARALVTAERTAINFLQTLSSTATLAHQFAAKIRGTKAQLLDTRKTLPGLRLAQKYAVCCGGGHNHRFGLYDAILIKENHIASCGSITIAVKQARKLYANKSIEVEVRNLAELREALTVKPNIIMLDNFNLRDIKQAVIINQRRAKLEVSGGVNINNIGKFAKTGVDYISVGAITKTVIPIELSMLIRIEDSGSRGEG